MTETLREEVLSVLASDLSSNEIAHFSGINQSIMAPMIKLWTKMFDII